jgi:hypothetical protein
MRKSIAGLLFGGAVFGATVNGTLTDVMCKDKDVANHTRKCALGCAKSGFAVVTSDGKFLKLDEQGNSKALAALKASSKDKDLKVTVTGDVDGETIKVTSLELK